MTQWVSVLAIAALLGGSASAGAAVEPAGPAGPYEVVELGALEPGGSAGPVAVDASGRVAGAASVGTVLRGFLHDGEVMLELAPLPGQVESSVHDLNDLGVAVGRSSEAGGTATRPVRWDGTVAQELPLPAGATSAVALGVSDDGTVVGTATAPDGERFGVRWRAGTVEVLDDVLPVPVGSRVEAATRVDDDGRVIGRLWLPTGEPAAFWFDGSAVRLVRAEPGQPVDAVAFGPAGVVGNAGERAFLWRDGTASGLPALAGDSCTAAADLDGNGRVVGRSWACGRDPTPRAVLWQGSRAVDLQTLLPAGSGLRLVDARAVAGGRIAALAVDGDGRSRAVALTPQRSLEAFVGLDRVGTALAVAGTVAPGTRSNAVIASGTAPADAAVAAVLAAHLRAPLLLTWPGTLDPRVEQALATATHPGGAVALVGGRSVLPRAIEERLIALGHPVVRHAGADRYETAVRVAEALGGPGRAVLVSGDAIDAPAAVPVAVHERAALLWTERTSLPPATRSYLDARPGWPRTAVGRAAGADPTAQALRGVDRGETAVLVARTFSTWPPVITVAPADRPIDGVVAGWMAAAAGGPVLLADERLPALSGNYLSELPFLPAFRTVGAVGPGVAEQLAPFTR